MLIWVTFVITSLCNVPMFAVGYGYSTEVRGTTKDAAFWFLLQGSISQFFGTGYMIIPLLGAAKVRRWIWLPPAVVAMIFTVSAVPLYLYVPKKWSSLCMLLGNAVQAFLSFQLAPAT